MLSIFVETGQRAQEQGSAFVHGDLVRYPLSALFLGRGQPPRHFFFREQRLERLSNQTGKRPRLPCLLYTSDAADEG